MDESILQDLFKKLSNTVRDFSLEHNIPGLVDVSVESNRVIVEVKEPLLKGHYTDARGILNESIYPADPLTGVIEGGSVADLPVEDLLTPREKEDYQVKRGKK